MSADGSGPLLLPRQFRLDIAGDLIVDSFAGFGGVSEAIEQALGRHADIAMNHDADALSAHQVNHPQSRHVCADVREVCPIAVTGGLPVGLFHGSPDCTDHSQAKGGQPRGKKIRALSWIFIRWAGQKRPTIITLECVKQLLRWGPLIAKRCPKTGRVKRIDGTVAGPGERVPLEQQHLIPDPKRAGQTWARFVEMLRGHGYSEIRTWVLKASDYGAATTRERLFMMARRDGIPVADLVQTHARKPSRRLKPWRPAADFIDFSLPCPSIFMTRDEVRAAGLRIKRPLEDPTLVRIATGVVRYVLETGDPFIVPIANYGSGVRVNSIREPLSTITAFPKGGLHSLIVPTLVQTGYGEREGQAPRCLDIHGPLGTIVAGGCKHALVTAFLAQHNNHRGIEPNSGHDARGPLSTITTKGSQQGLVTAHLAHFRGNCDARAITDPLMTISAGGEHHALVTCRLSQEIEAGALRVAAFLMRYHGSGGQWLDCREPLTAITTKDRLALVTVTIHGATYVIVDIGLRMFEAEELKLCQGLPKRYVITHGHDGRKFTRTKQVHMIGNSVSPFPVIAMLQANFPQTTRRAA